ncbi:MAG: DUF4445 domain-containing protein, partial [Oscillospiraceae bacterium]|nr:DUF4445 domain-containing protein [Oscillospiraceae bacterium]
MAELTIRRGGEVRVLPFEGETLLDELLKRAGVDIARPCGGRGSCGKCAVTLEGEVSPPNAAERRAGCRLSCQVMILGDAVVTLPETARREIIETGVGEYSFPLRPMEGKIGAAVDIGTTTVAVRVYDLTDGSLIGSAAARNPQGSVAADVMGRIGAAMAGGLTGMQEQITGCIQKLAGEAGGANADAWLLTGNTTMLYLLTGRDPESLSRAPFKADTLFDTEIGFFGGKAYLPPCMNAFVGADITCAVLDSGMCGSDEVSLLCDIGTNGEIALWKGGTLYVTSTAAGPAFEGAGISCGCGSVEGAVDKVAVVNGALSVHTIGGGKAVGVCGSGLIDAVAAGLLTEAIDETGALEENELPLADDVALQPEDIRAVQLAKAAIAAGIATLIETAGTSVDEIGTLYIAGGFGSHLDVRSAAAIGLIPAELAGKVKVLGNAALSGAVRALLDTGAKEELQRIAASSVHVDLGGHGSCGGGHGQRLPAGLCEGADRRGQPAHAGADSADG